MPRGTQVPITPEVLSWTISSSGYSAEEVAERIHVPADKLRSWMSGSAKPGLTPLRQLASFLRRPLATFLLPAPPRSMNQQIEFRHPPGETRRALNSTELTHLREAARLQRGLGWILTELGGPLADIPRISPTISPQRAAEEHRRRIGVAVDQQLEWRTDTQSLHAWRQALQGMNVIVLLLPMGSSSARGFSLWNEHAPLIAVNTHWNAAARTFTLFHEYAHLLTRTNSACTGHVTARIRQGEDSLERWCEEFAAEFLAPWTSVRDCLVHDYDWRQGQTIDDLSLVKRLAAKFHISLRAMTIKLIDHEVASWELYRQILPQADDKRGGGGGEGRRRLQIRIDEYGERTAQVLLKGLERDVLSRTDVLGYLDIADSDLDILGSRVTTR